MQRSTAATRRGPERSVQVIAARWERFLARLRTGRSEMPISRATRASVKDAQPFAARACVDESSINSVLRTARC